MSTDPQAPDTRSQPPAAAFVVQDVHRPGAAAERSAVVDLAAIRHNVRLLAELAHPAALMAVVKADAYGHGAVPVARAALVAGAHGLGVAHVREALELREAGIRAPILAWLHTADTDFEAALQRDIALGVSGAELFEIAATAQRIGRTARIHLKVDTGLGRNGFALSQWPQVLETVLGLERDGALRVDGIFSHLAVADQPERPETDEQVEAFAAAVRQAREAGLAPRFTHLANTPATLSLGQPGALADPQTMRGDIVRTGVGLYGVSPFADRSAQELGLLPAMTLRTSVANIKRVPSGQGVSYGLSYRTSEATTLALIPMGYGDGVPRVATGAPVMIEGRTYPVVGRIAMDQMVVDLRTTEDMSHLLGAEAVLFGGEGAPSVREWSEAAGTIDYEIITRISPRVQRVHVDTRADLAFDRVAQERAAHARANASETGQGRADG
ncbi:alanine racemase [Kocuria palustris]|uniref:alanine racemase n=1 Tax=Kocuria palustris TaxID=71999 RepID=UPI002F90E295